MYEGLALFYDSLTEDINYGALGRFTVSAVKKSSACKEYKRRGEKPIVLDCACGTGTLTRILSEKGFDSIGLDSSEDMLDVARARTDDESVLYICQDMCRMDLFGSVAAITCMTDSVNHIISQKRLENFFARCHNFLDPGGILIFDVLSEEHFTDGKTMNCFSDYDTVSCFWSGRYNEKNRICTYDISCFSLTEEGLYARTDDVVREKVWTEKELKQLLSSVGFRVEMTDGSSAGLGSFADDRLFFICTKNKEIL